MLTPIRLNDVQVIQNEINRQYKLGSMMMDQKEYDDFSTMMETIGEFSDDGLYDMGKSGTTDERISDLLYLLQSVEEFELLYCQKYYRESVLSLNSSVEDILKFISSLSSVSGKRYAVFIQEYPLDMKEKQQSWNTNLFIHGYPRYGFAVVIFGDE